MRAFINFFLVAYALDAAVSTIDDLIIVLSDVHLMGLIRNFIGLGIFLLCIPVYLSLGIDSRLPKRVLLPPVLLALWAGLGCMPLPLFFDERAVFLGISLLQLALSALAFVAVRRMSGGHWLLQPALFDRPVFRLRNTVLFASGNIVLMPAAICLLLVSSAYLYLDNKTAGFMQIGTDGLYLQERTYVRDDKKIHLLAMIHVGNREYYEELGDYLNNDNIIVLAEGVTDTTGLIRNFPSYSRIADLIGLETQENMAMYGKLLEYEQLKDLHGEDSTDAQEPVIVRADIDSQDLSEETILFIRNVGELFNSSRSLAESFSAYIDWYTENMTPEKEKHVMGELIDERNAVLLHYLDEVLLHYDNIVIPWGALHMPALEQAVLEKNFTPGERTSRLAVGYDRLIQSSSP